MSCEKEFPPNSWTWQFQTTSMRSTLPWRLRVFEKFPTRPQMAAMRRLLIMGLCSYWSYWVFCWREMGLFWSACNTVSNVTWTTPTKLTIARVKRTSLYCRWNLTSFTAKQNNMLSCMQELQYLPEQDYFLILPFHYSFSLTTALFLDNNYTPLPTYDTACCLEQNGYHAVQVVVLPSRIHRILWARAFFHQI